jgi:hypothetical protein
MSISTSEVCSRRAHSTARAIRTEWGYASISP